MKQSIRDKANSPLFIATVGLSLLGCSIFLGGQVGMSTSLSKNGSDEGPKNGLSASDKITNREEANAGKPDRAISGRELPNGITDIEGEGGRGIHRMVLKNGVWYPVYAPGDDMLAGIGAENPDFVPPGTALSVVPLAIASASPPDGRVDEAYTFRFLAVGGKAPYQWSMQLQEGTDRFTLNVQSGQLSGLSNKPLTTSMRVSLTDATSRTINAEFPFIVKPAEALAIETTSLQTVTAGQPHTALLTARGGIPPYHWNMTSANLPKEWMLNATTGSLHATAVTTGEFSLDVTVTDKQDSTASMKLLLKVTAGLDITTATHLLPAAPGGRYVKVFEATGGTTPYSWRVAEGSLPPGWTLTSSGELTGLATRQEAMHLFTLEVKDSAGLTFLKSFDLAVRDALLAIPSREKVGLAWSQQALVQAGFTGVAITRSTSPQETGDLIYQGVDSNMVDRGLPTGITLFYTLWGLGAGIEPAVYARAQVTLLPIIKYARGTPGETGDPFADAVVSFTPLATGGWGSGFAPLNVTGPPWISGSQTTPQTYSPASAPTDVLSLHARSTVLPAGGSIVLEFKDNIIDLGQGADFTVFENVFFIRANPNNRFMEPAVVSIALFEGQWFRFPIDVIPTTGGTLADESNPSYYARGFAGRNATTGDDPTNPLRSGGDAFDIQELAIPGLTWVRFIKIEATGHNARADDIGGEPVKHTAVTGALSGQSSSGFDLDAISAVNY